MKALVTGASGQDGSYLCELLLEKGYEVHGIIRRSSSFNTKRIDHIFSSLHLHYGDMTDAVSIYNVINQHRPDEIYNLAAQSHVKVSFELPEYTGNSDGLGFLRLLEAVRTIPGYYPRIYQASTSEMFGLSPGPQNENTPFRPASPYGTAKLYAHNLADNYRRSYKMHISCGILFNHESPRRGETFVTRKITKAIAKWHHTGQWDLTLGNVNAYRDWGHAKDYVRAMWLMTQQDNPDDYVIATNETRSVMDFYNTADQLYIDRFDRKVPLPFIDPKYERPNEVPFLLGEPFKAKAMLGWEPTIDFVELVEEMLEHDIVQFGR